MHQPPISPIGVEEAGRGREKGEVDLRGGRNGGHLTQVSLALLPLKCGYRVEIHHQGKGANVLAQQDQDPAVTILAPLGVLGAARLRIGLLHCLVSVCMGLQLCSSILSHSSP